MSVDFISNKTKTLSYVIPEPVWFKTWGKKKNHLGVEDPKHLKLGKEREKMAARGTSLNRQK